MSNDQPPRESEAITLTKIQAGTAKFNSAVWAIVAVAAMFFVYKSIEALSGADTHLSVRLLANLNLSFWVPTILTAASTGAFLYQRRRADLLDESLQQAGLELEHVRRASLGSNVIDVTHQLPPGDPPPRSPEDPDKAKP